MAYKIEQLDKQIIIQQRNTAAGNRDLIGGFPYSYTDLITGDGNGVYAMFKDPTNSDVLTAAQHKQVTDVIMVVRYDSRIKPSMRVKYWNGTAYDYYEITIVENDFFQNRFMRIHAKRYESEVVAG